MKKLLCPCGAKSVPGLIRSVSLCQEHFNDLTYLPVEDPKHKLAVAMLERSKQRAVQPQTNTR